VCDGERIVMSAASRVDRPLAFSKNAVAHPQATEKTTMSRQAVFRGIPVEIVQARVKARSPDRFYYEIRTSNDDWASGATLEEKVSVNFWGTLISPSKISFGEDDYLELSDAEMSALLVEQEEEAAESNA
jgi:hypothetical protein